MTGNKCNTYQIKTIPLPRMRLADHSFDLHCDVTLAGKPKKKKNTANKYIQEKKEINFQVDRNEDDPRPRRPVFLEP